MRRHQALVWRALTPVLLLCPPELPSALQLGSPAEPVAAAAAADGGAPPSNRTDLGPPAPLEELLESQLAVLGICYPSARNSYLQGDDGLRWCRSHLFSSESSFQHSAVISGVIYKLLNVHELENMRVTQWQWVGNTTRYKKKSHELLLSDPRNPFAAVNVSRLEVARLLSHRRALEYMVRAGHKLGLVLEGAAAWKESSDGSLVKRIAGIIRNASSYDGDWDLIRLSDCPGVCRQEAGSAANFTPPNASWYGLGRGRLPKCLRAYVVSARGARKFLANSLPIVTTVDHLIALLDRRGLMAVYDPVAPALVPSAMKSLGSALDVLPENCSYCPLDPSFDVWYERQVIEAVYRPLLTGEVPPVQQMHGAGRQWEIVSQHCSLFSRANRSAIGEEPDDNTKEVLRYMERLDLRGFLVYDFRTPVHSHAFIHEAIFNAFTHMAMFSEKPLHVCWFEPQDLEGISITRALGYSARNVFRQWRGRLGSSLVLASPKHISWSNDPGFTMLPRDPTSRYVFHDFVPEHFRPLQEQGRALQWVVFGRDGGHARLESVNWLTQQRFPWRLTWADLPEMPPMACEGPVCSDLASRIYVAPWATALLPQQINTSMDLGERLTVAPRSNWTGNSSLNSSRNASENAPQDGQLLLRFVGSVWDGNELEMYRFISGCHKARVLVSGHGWQGFQQELEPASLQVGSRVGASELQRLLLSGEHFAPAIQGSAHLCGNFSYVSDRLLSMAATGRLIGTNNPAAAKFFAAYKDAIVVRSEAELCDAYVDALETPSPGREAAVRGLMRHIVEKHTYASRFKDLLELFTSAHFGPAAS